MEGKVWQVHVQDDEFHSIAKGNVHQGTNGITHIVCDTLGSVCQDTGKRNDGNSIHSEDDAGAHAGYEFDSDADGDKDQ